VWEHASRVRTHRRDDAEDDVEEDERARRLLVRIELRGSDFLLRIFYYFSTAGCFFDRVDR
jgi:hypothetical protein